MVALDNIDMMTEINFDNWIINKFISNKGTHIHITGQYSHVGNLEEIYRETKTNKI